MKRAFELAAVCAGIFLILPVVIIIAFLIKATSPGPLFFRQERMGWHNKPFQLYKFRSMGERAEEMGSSVTIRNDPRITPLGKILRRTKVDELPQLINVFKGDMSLVGPRPDVPEIVRNYTPDMKDIFKIRPGITSVATLHLRDEEEILAKVTDPDTFYENVLVPLKVKLAMEHVDRNSCAYDLQILFQTVWMLILGRWWPIKEHPEVTHLKESISKGIYNHMK